MKLHLLLIALSLIPLTMAAGQDEDGSYRDFVLSGRLQSSIGYRIYSDKLQESGTIQEGILRISMLSILDNSELRVTADLIADRLRGRPRINLDRDADIIDLREAYYLFSPQADVDIKIGRQILTWGTGDLLFLNDHFPKDFRSFIIGRGDDYIKAPQTSLKISYYSAINLDIVYSPVFEPDRYITGERVSYWNPLTFSTSSVDLNVLTRLPDTLFSDDTLSLRLHTLENGVEYCLYYHSGFRNSPSSFSLVTGKPGFDEIQSFGFSIRGQLGSTIWNTESVYTFSDAKEQRRFYTRGEEYKLLIGLEKEILDNITASTQLYYETTVHTEEMNTGLPISVEALPSDNLIATLRIYASLDDNNVIFNSFLLYASQNEEFAWLPRITFKQGTNAELIISASVFGGENERGYYSQLRGASNICLSYRMLF